MNRRENIQEISKLLFTTLFQAVTMLYTVITRWPDKRLECGRIINEATNVGIIAREEFVPVLYAREGNYQDNDDVMNVYADESDQLREYYGDFFFTELVEASDNRNKVLVADVNDTAVGCLAVTADIAFDTLRRTHHIGTLFNTCSLDFSVSAKTFDKFSKVISIHYLLKIQSPFNCILLKKNTKVEELISSEVHLNVSQLLSGLQFHYHAKFNSFPF